MKTAAKFLLVAAGVALLSAHAAGQETQFAKKRTSQVTLKQELGAMLASAQKAKMTDDQATQKSRSGLSDRRHHRRAGHRLRE